MRGAIPGTVAITLSALSLLVACPGPKMPSGPPPAYEDPPPPSWLNDAAAPPSSGTFDPLEAPPAAPPGDGGLPSI